MASNYPQTYSYLRTYGAQVESEIKTRLKGHGKYATGKLYNSIKFKIKETKEKFTISFLLADYGQYVDKGTKPSKYADSKGKGSGKSKFIESLMIWCRIKGLPEGAAFAIRRNIWRRGLPPTNFFTIPTTRRLRQLEAGVAKSMAKDVENIIKKDFS